jgi:hypothetical protein
MSRSVEEITREWWEQRGWLISEYKSKQREVQSVDHIHVPQ